MGADFICAIVFIEKKLPRNWEKIVANYGFSKEDVRHYVYNNNLDDVDDVKLAVVLNMIQAVKSFRCLVNNGSREIEIFEIKKRRMCITGGMSWGDDPTDAFGVFSRIVDMPEKLLKRIGLSVRL